ncbi:MAG: class I SAM-dependent methyltransferase [Hyphomicrobiales bacterium]
MKRTHDKFYLTEEKNVPVKDSFKMIADHIEIEFLDPNRQLIVADIGCAVGVFPNYISQRFPSMQVTGCEYDAELLSAAQANYPDLDFLQFDLCDRSSSDENSFDVITLCGVLSIFDDYEGILDNMLYWVRPGGRLLIFNMFNPHDLDVFVKYKHSNEGLEAGLESGWNIISQKSISDSLVTRDISNFEFVKFDISVDLPRRPDDHVRSWTENHADGQRFIINGLNLLQPHHLLKIRIAD